MTHRLLARCARALVPTTLAAGATALTLALAATSAPVPAAFAAAPTPSAYDLTVADVEASNEEVRLAYGALVAMWSDEFAAVGARFSVPRIARYRAPVRTACGVMYPGNAGYCPTSNAIYYDDVFVAAQGKRAAAELGSDGDMAAVGVVAHEMGHAVAMQLGFRSRVTYEHEAVADCLTGAFARSAAGDGSLEEGDLEEAFFAMAAAADPTPTLTGDERADRRALARLARQSHGTREQRMTNFEHGLASGPAGCLAQLR